MHYILITVSPPPTVSTPSPMNCIPSRSTVSDILSAACSSLCGCSFFEVTPCVYTCSFLHSTAFPDILKLFSLFFSSFCVFRVTLPESHYQLHAHRLFPWIIVAQSVEMGKPLGSVDVKMQGLLLFHVGWFNSKFCFCSTQGKQRRRNPPSKVYIFSLSSIFQGFISLWKAHDKILCLKILKVLWSNDCKIF